MLSNMCLVRIQGIKQWEDARRGPGPHVGVIWVTELELAFGLGEGGAFVPSALSETLAEVNEVVPGVMAGRCRVERGVDGRLGG